MDLQALLMDKDEELQEKSKKYERHNSIMEGNLHKAEQEVQKLDAIIDGVLEVRVIKTISFEMGFDDKSRK